MFSNRRITTMRKTLATLAMRPTVAAPLALELLPGLLLIGGGFLVILLAALTH